MGETLTVKPVLPILGLISRHPDALVWGRQQVTSFWGGELLVSPPLPFSHTRYYEKEMGTGLLYQLAAFKQTIDPGDIAEVKLHTNALEREFIGLSKHPELRPLNLDPGYLGALKFVLATTKDAAHRIFLGRGIFAEVTLLFQDGAWREEHWTYPNFRDAPYKSFLLECRKYYLQLTDN